MHSPRNLRAAVVMAAAAAAVIVAGLVFVSSQLVPAPSQTLSQNSPPKVVAKTAISCPSSGLVIYGAFDDCATFLEGLGCPSGSLESPRVMHLHGSSDDFILYVEVDGGYHGPGTYELAPWPHDSLEGNDGIAKVAIREWNGGRLWQSFAGSLTIGATERSGNVDATLVSPDARSGSTLHIQGEWQCP